MCRGPAGEGGGAPAPGRPRSGPVRAVPSRFARVPRLPRPGRLRFDPRALWRDRSPRFRRSAIAVAAVVVLYVLIRFVPVPGVPCEVSAVEDCPSGVDTIALAPADSYAFGHIELGSDEDQVEAAADLVAKFPSFGAISQGILE